MLTTKTLSVVIATVATLSLNGYAAERQNNPLHPAYYPERVGIEFDVMPGQRYLDTRNPLHPTFAKTTFNTEWMTTGMAGGKAYVDSRNPLHPAFKRY